MTTDNGGWTMFGRGKGAAGKCWKTDGDCNVGHLANDKLAWHNGGTAKMSNEWVNGITFSRIRMSGTNGVKANWYWLGKNAGGCTYVHTRVSNGHCNCASPNVGMGSKRCGSTHGNHRGVGDWPSSGGCLHSTHYNENWYFRKYIKSGSGCGSNYCSGTGRNSGRCDIQMWVR